MISEQEQGFIAWERNDFFAFFHFENIEYLIEATK